MADFHIISVQMLQFENQYDQKQYFKQSLHGAMALPEIITISHCYTSSSI